MQVQPFGSIGTNSTNWNAALLDECRVNVVLFVGR